LKININAKKVNFSYDSKTLALKDITLNVKAKRIGIVGQNGSGKTTFLSLLMGFLKPDKGSIKVNGLIPHKDREKILSTFAPAFEKSRLPYGMKVRELIQLVGELTGDPSNVEELAKDLGLLSFKDKKVYALSSGQSQLLWIFNALSDRKRIPVLDEPFVHLDIHAYKRVARVLRDHFESYILTSHIPEDVELLTDSVIVLEEGEVQWYGKLPQSDSTYEVFIPSKARVKLPNVLADFGNVIVCKCPRDLLESLMKEGLIIGYKRAGVRLLYAKIRD